MRRSAVTHTELLTGWIQRWNLKDSLKSSIAAWMRQTKGSLSLPVNPKKVVFLQTESCNEVERLIGGNAS